MWRPIELPPTYFFEIRMGSQWRTAPTGRRNRWDLFWQLEYTSTVIMRNVILHKAGLARTGHDEDCSCWNTGNWRHPSCLCWNYFWTGTFVALCHRSVASVLSQTPRSAYSRRPLLPLSIDQSEAIWPSFLRCLKSKFFAWSFQRWK